MKKILLLMLGLLLGILLSNAQMNAWPWSDEKVEFQREILNINECMCEVEEQLGQIGNLTAAEYRATYCGAMYKKFGFTEEQSLITRSKNDNQQRVLIWAHKQEDLNAIETKFEKARALCKARRQENESSLPNKKSIG